VSVFADAECEVNEVAREQVTNERSEDLLRLGVERLRDHAFMTLNADGALTFWNLGAEELLGWRREQAVGASVSSVLGPGGPKPGISQADLQDVLRKGSVTAVRRLSHQDGSIRLVTATILALQAGTRLLGYAVAAYPVASESGQPEAHTAASEASPDTHRQLSESRTLLALETAARTQAETARVRLLRRLVIAEEDERRRLARNLHDGLGQHLTALRLMLESLSRQLPARDVPSMRAAEALEMLVRIDQDVDFIAWELRPAALDELGLAKVLETYVKEWSRQTGIAATFRARPAQFPRFADEIEVSVYRIAQESLNNVAKHARARSANVLLELRGDDLLLVVEDNGIGVHSTSGAETMIGLRGMRERALAVGGTLELEPTPGGGTTVLACIPISAPHQRAAITLESDSSTAAEEFTDAGADGAGLTAIRARLQELQRAVAARDEFIATVAHELRNPIAPLMFQVRLALNKVEPLAASGAPVSVEWIRSQLGGIEQRLHRVLETLDRLLDVSRLSSGRIDLQLESMNLGDVVREVIDGLDAELAVARCKLTLAERHPATGVWDRVRVEQICRNLLSNAIRFGAGRPIEVTVDADRDYASISVRDHGIGIAPEQQPKIFERFERGMDQRSGGFGVGLWVVRTITTAMGGTVSVESRVGAGACFTVQLPRRPVREVLDPTGGTPHE
jgi:PAS domain S-box-containing protein